MENNLSLLKPSETLRKKLLAEEQRLRKKQPEHWAKTKYRKFANTVKVGAELFGATLITEKDSKAPAKRKGATLSMAQSVHPNISSGCGAKKGKAKAAKAGRKKKKK